MSNIREIDRAIVNLDLVQTLFYLSDGVVGTKEKDWKYFLRFCFSPREGEYVEGLVKYDTEELAKERIREIIKMQNNK